MKKRCQIIFLIFTVALGLVSVVNAETTARRGGDSDALAKAQYMMRQMATERDTLQTENEKLQQEIESLKKQVSGLRSKVGKLNNTLDRSEQGRSQYVERAEVLTDRLHETREKTREVVAKFRETINTLREVEAERSQLELILANRDDALNVCVEKNVAMYEANLDLLDQYKNKGFWASLRQAEPVTGMKRVKVENELQDYRDSLNELRVNTSALYASSPTP